MLDSPADLLPIEARVPSACSAPDAVKWIRNQADTHACFRHPLFSCLESIQLTSRQAGRLLRNYDAHATALRRLLLQAATIMPEEAVGFILENVRNEYGNGCPDKRHQLQLLDVAWQAGVDQNLWTNLPVHEEINTYIELVTPLYYPVLQDWTKPIFRPAIAGGAIAATELLAIREFQYLQKAFAKLNLEHHIWFDHVNIEVEHGDESLDLALFFINRHDAFKEVEFGLQGVLSANICLYDGLLSCLQEP